MRWAMPQRRKDRSGVRDPQPPDASTRHVHHLVRHKGRDDQVVILRLPPSVGESADVYRRQDDLTIAAEATKNSLADERRIGGEAVHAVGGRSVPTLERPT